VESSFISAVAIATITRLLVYATTCVALPIFRRRGGVPEPQFKVPFGIAAAVLSCALILWLLTSIDFAKEGISLAVWLGVGFIIFAAMRFTRRGPADSGLRENTPAEEILP
jgi:amino acid transporter